MTPLQVFGQAVARDVPAALTALRSILVAVSAVQRATEEELFQARAVHGGQLAGIMEKGRLATAAVARTPGRRLEERGELLRGVSGHDSSAQT